ncbi:MAG TPA: aminofutalosine synthase MqnE [Terrimicrobiaceae bacterium]|nr:aminofutalosine synthase MqnE [Terrimicrobiaceae bacterium]
MNSRLIPEELQPILRKVEQGIRVSSEDAMALYESADINGIGAIANILRQRKNGNVATYIHNRYINYSNVCLLSCQFCAFGAKKREAHAFEFAIPQIVEAVADALSHGVTEIHMVGGLHPTLKKEWYLELLSNLRVLDEKLIIKAFTAIEVRHLAERVFRQPIRQTLELLREHGLGAITGGGAEIFDPEIRDKICRGKESAEEWAEVHRIWHQMGQHSTCTMLYGHIETARHRIDHLRRLRELQDETGGFTGFIPFAFEPEGARPTLRGLPHATAFEELRNLAVSRIFLDNIPHITAYWISLGLPLAQLSLSYGVDDLHGTIIEEKIFHMAGARTPQQQTVEALEKAIREAGRIPMQRNSFYQRISDRMPGAPHLAAA